MTPQELQQHLEEKLDLKPNSLQPGTLRRTLDGRSAPVRLNGVISIDYSFRFNIVIGYGDTRTDIMLGAQQLFIATGIQAYTDELLEGKFSICTGLESTDMFTINNEPLTFNPRPVLYGQFDQLVKLQVPDRLDGLITMELIGLTVMNYNIQEAAHKIWQGQMEAAQYTKVNIEP